MRQYRSEDGGVTWIPTEVYTAGALIERGSIACNPIGRWVEDGWMCDNCPESMYRTISGIPYCSGTYDVDKYVEVDEQVSYDGGMTWETTASTDVLVEEKSYDCGYRERTISGTPYCSGVDGVDKYVEVDEQVSYDGGTYWETTASTDVLVEEKSYDCGYRERTTSGTPYCVGVDKYQDVYNQVSIDGGETWTTTASTNVLIEAQSTDCGYVPPQYRTISGVPYCSGTYDVDKYIEVDDQVSYDGGVTWETTASTDVLVEEKSYDCGYRERTTSGSPYCVGYDKYEDVYDQVSYDGGTYWETTATTNVLIEAQSTDCGYVPPTPTFDGKWLAYRGGTVTSSAECDSTSAITYGEIAFPPLYSVVIGDCVTTIGASAFTEAHSLSSATIGSGVTTIGNYAFYDCSRLSSVTIPDSVTTIGYGAFLNCRRLTTCIIGNSVTSISSYAFQNCYALTSITIPNSVTTIGIYAFQSCSGLTSIDIPDSVTSISSGMCSGCRSLTSIAIPSGVTSIGGYAFAACTSLSSVNIPDGVTSINDYTFSDCRGLTSITIPSGVTSIGDSAFRNCSSLTSITIPSGVTSIRMDAFWKCSGLTAITVNAITPPELGTYALVDTNNCSIYVPCQSVDAYKAAYGWSTYASRIEGIPPCAQYRTISGTPYCNGYDKYEDVYDQVSYDGGTSWETTATTNVLIEAQSTDCGYVPPTPTFDGKWLATDSEGRTSSAECDATSAITSGEVLTIYLVDIKIGDCVTTIGNRAFQKSTRLSSATISNSVTSIGDWAFYNCSGLTTCTIGNSVTNIGDDTFYNCYSLSSVNIPSGVTTIGDGTFNNCRSLTSITIPSGVTSIGGWAFWKCSGLTSVTIPSGLTTIGSGAFGYCSSLTSITIPSGVTSISDSAFSDCSGLTSVTIPSSVTRIRESAFSDCRSLTSITVEATTPPTIDDGESEFNNTNNCPIYVPAASVSAYQSAWSDYASRIQAIP